MNQIEMKKIVGRLSRRVGLYEAALEIQEWLTIKRSLGYKRWRKEMLAFLSQFINKGDICFDIGANIGNMTRMFLDLGAKVVAIEPQSLCMKRLQWKYQWNKKVVLVQKAVGEKEGTGELLLSKAHTICSMSKEWIEVVKGTERFGEYTWDEVENIRITTLDKLIRDYGVPSFCKIDVEGSEYHVLKGLSKPVKALSFEFTPEFISASFRCIEHLFSLGYAHFNYAISDAVQLSLPNWVDYKGICKLLTELSEKTPAGDIYARL
jgi:FkbM family methyltransferase